MKLNITIIPTLKMWVIYSKKQTTFSINKHKDLNEIITFQR